MCPTHLKLIALIRIAVQDNYIISFFFTSLHLDKDINTNFGNYAYLKCTSIQHHHQQQHPKYFMDFIISNPVGCYVP